MENRFHDPLLKLLGGANALAIQIHAFEDIHHGREDVRAGELDAG